MDAASELAGILETVEATRGDVAELRHEMRRELELIRVRLDTFATKADLQEMRAEFRVDLQGVRTDLQAVRGDMSVALERGLRAQTRWMLAMLATFLVAVYFRS